MKRVLVTGAAGFLGRHVMHQLKMLDDVEVVGIDNFEPLCGSDISDNSLRGDVCESDGWQFLTPGIGRPTHIIHLAAIGRNLTCEQNPRRAFEVNVDGTLNMLELAVKCRAEFLHCSSNIVLSNRSTTYRLTKRVAEDLVRLYAQHGVRAMILRPSNIAGAGQSRTEFQPCAFASMDKCFEEKGYIELTGDGMQRRDFINVKDVARAFVQALDFMTPGVTMDICTGTRVTLLNVTELLGVPVKFVDPRPGDAMDLVSDPHPALTLMNFRSKCSFPDTVAESFPMVMRAKAKLHSSKQLQEGPGERV